MKNKLILILAVVTGLIAAGGIYMYLTDMKKTYQESGDFARVAVASQRIPAKTQITSQMFDLKDMPVKYINERAAFDSKEVLGKTAKSDIWPGEQILRDQLANDKDASDGLPFLLQSGKRAVTIAVNEVSGIAGLVKPGDRVDVMGTFDLQAAVGQEKSSVTSLLIQNASVLSTDQSTTQAAGNSQDSKKAAPAHTITLSVTPEQAQPLILCSEKGSIRLLLRPATDQETINLPSFRMNQLVH
ncbi:Flp pilus assembly protein CpaB [Pelotomaculum isophthalicicum JI]|uniref:Flp pilus assembly protein CpaB n=1 Tax=Pelotomaculum isophthalicicum JI TaxID=947010 RepID=A0A9X4JUT6_9FIRM|nr:Flp pilus assembly protein CpaB [Pelotomaculum isophthalicicum]MDF9406926.1 Flp pilus assembly protein CpaB [Pelotomaculum isophthalicicum JI]